METKTFIPIRKRLRNELMYLTSDISDIASDMFANLDCESLQLVDFFGKEFVKKSQKKYTEEELDTIQNIIDIFYNSVLNK